MMPLADDLNLETEVAPAIAAGTYPKPGNDYAMTEGA